MYRLIFSILSLLPWWAYAFIALLLANATYGLWQTHETRTTQAEIAIRQGPPTITKIGDYNPRLRDTPFEEMRIAGFLRADLGVGRLEGTVPKSYLVLDTADRSGPLLAVLFVGSDDQAGLPDLVATANENGLVTASGFRRTLDWSEVSGQLRLQGVRREVLLMEAMVGDRAVALREKGATDLPFVFALAGLTAAAALMALYRRSKARKGQPRRFRKRTNLQAAVPRSAPVETPVDSTTWDRPAPKPQRQPRQRAAKTPWGGSAAMPPDARTLVSANKITPEAAPVVPSEPPFKSVFPGGGSGFRFKSADEIIRQSFGTVSQLTPSPPKDK